MNDFFKVTKKGLALASTEEVVRLALSLWHERFLPSFSGMDLEEKRTAGYMVDFLSRFECVDQEQKLRLRELADAAKQELPRRTSQSRVDSLARDWGLDNDLRPFTKALLPYQTRHYRRSRAS